MHWKDEVGARMTVLRREAVVVAGEAGAAVGSAATTTMEADRLLSSSSKVVHRSLQAAAKYAPSLKPMA